MDVGPKTAEKRRPRMTRRMATVALCAAVITSAYLVLMPGLGITVLLAATVLTLGYLLEELRAARVQRVRLSRLVSTDQLTGLSNRERFREVIAERISAAQRSGGSFAVMLIDLDRFKEINDTLGHHYGDLLLQSLGPRLERAVGDGGLVARLGGDEFAVLPPEGIEGAAGIEQLAAGLTHCLRVPFGVDELSLEVGASIGIARFPDDAQDAVALLRCADTAMYAAKQAHSPYKLYGAEQNRHAIQRRSVLSDIGAALNGGQMVVHYQPITRLADGSVTGAEGLVR
jgi:diguanylate cyclase (GGDEF)-like protein